MTFIATAFTPRPHLGKEGPGNPLPVTTAISLRGAGSYALVVASARIGRIARLPTPTPVMPTPVMARRYNHGPRGVHARVSKGHNRARRACNSHARRQKPDHELVHRFGPPALSDAGLRRAICVAGHVRTEARRRSGTGDQGHLDNPLRSVKQRPPGPTVGCATSTATRLPGLEPGDPAPVWWTLQIARKCGRNGPWPEKAAGVYGLGAPGRR